MSYLLSNRRGTQVSTAHSGVLIVGPSIRSGEWQPSVPQSPPQIFHLNTQTSPPLSLIQNILTRLTVSSSAVYRRYIITDFSFFHGSHLFPAQSWISSIV